MKPTLNFADRAGDALNANVMRAYTDTPSGHKNKNDPLHSTTSEEKAHITLIVCFAGIVFQLST